MADPILDTAAQRPATGLDRGARELIFRVVGEVSGAGPLGIIEVFFEDRFGGRRDYYAALEQVWGPGVRRACEDAVSSAEINAEFPAGLTRSRISPAAAGAYVLLLGMPSPDFRLAVENTLQRHMRVEDAAPRITKILRARGAPWIFNTDGEFEWVGDEQVERELVRPALAALNDARFSGGVRSEFESARNELRAGTQVSLKQAVHEAGCAVESAMKVVLDEHRVAYDKGRDAAQKLFDHLESAGLVPRYMERTVLAPMVPRNKTAGHGAGAIAHNVGVGEAESIVAAAAGAIAYLGKQLP